MPRPAKSAELHRLQGTRPHDSTVDPDDDSRVFVSGRMKMPAEWKGTERETAWKLLFNPIAKRKTLTRADSAAATIIVEMWRRWQTVAQLAAENPIVEVSWVDKHGTEHFKQVESPASKMATSLEHKLLAALKEFSATPASRERTKRTKEPELKPSKVKTERERLEEQEAELKAQQAKEAAREKQHTELLDSINLDEVKIV